MVVDIGNEHAVLVDFANILTADMQDVALEFQRALRAAGAGDAGVSWYGRGVYGAFQITSPYRGSNATIYLTVPLDVGDPISATPGHDEAAHSLG